MAKAIRLALVLALVVLGMLLFGAAALAEQSGPGVSAPASATLNNG